MSEHEETKKETARRDDVTVVEYLCQCEHIHETKLIREGQALVVMMRSDCGIKAARAGESDCQCIRFSRVQQRIVPVGHWDRY